MQQVCVGDSESSSLDAFADTPAVGAGTAGARLPYSESSSPALATEPKINHAAARINPYRFIATAPSKPCEGPNQPSLSILS